ncbi:TPA: class II holin family protein [Escherichia coli]
MDQMEKITTGVSYTTSAVGTGYWFLQLLDRVSPSQWAAIGVLGSLLFGLLTYLTNLYFKSKRLVRTVLIFTESSDQLSRATDRVPGLPASPGYVQ